MGTTGGCVNCYEWGETEMYKEDGHYKKKCHACGHLGGPYVSEQVEGSGAVEERDDEEEGESEVSTMSDWLE